ncbi:DUF2637 domain-containing protein [Umezawaea beigongshangensis]|uniref:DUF2637 domain-containing protein n=1 Tax=Umezawaea beigongshangensis TaxID=2780383 RepID=UPI0018F18A61|nr:DUF2637 domain-containing protein [Umezawaea beigongshangensis]
MTTTFYDRRAERTAAAAQAEQQRADAERTRAETALAMVQVQQARAHAAAELSERRQQREQADKQATRQRRAATRARWAARLPEWLLSVLWATVIVSPITLAWQAQRSFAETTLALPATTSWLFPLAVEAGAWVCAFEAHRRTKAGLPVGALPTWMWVLAGIAAGINLLHGTADHGPVAGIALATMSLLGVLLHHVRQAADHAAAEGRDTAQLRRALWRRVRFPRLSFAAASIAAARSGRVDAETAWRQAWVDRYGVGPDSSRRDRRLARTITRHRWSADRKAARSGDLVIVGGVILPAVIPGLTTETTPAPPALTIVPAVAEPSAEPADTGTDTPVVQGELSPRAADLLIKVRTAIAAGELPAAPAATAIRKQFGGASETAREVRDALKHDARSEAA